MLISFDELEKFIDKQDVSFITSVDEAGFSNIKAMLPPRKREGLTVFYFTTNTSSMRVGQYRTNPKAAIYFYHKGAVHYQGVMLIGTMAVLEDEATKQMIWKPSDRVYYRQGVADPDYCVLRFVATSGRYYSDLKTESFTL